MGAMVLGAVLALAGCSANPPASHESASHSAMPTKDGDGTVSQWASIVAEQKSSLEDWKSKWDADTCSVAATFTCKIETLTGATIAKTIAISLASPETSTATNYIGTPPSEIRSLYADTRAAADSAQSAGDAWSAACSGSTAGDDCTGLLFKFSSAVDALETKMQGWSPYL